MSVVLTIGAQALASQLELSKQRSVRLLSCHFPFIPYLFAQEAAKPWLSACLLLLYNVAISSMKLWLRAGA